MAYIEYNNLKTPNEVLGKIADYVKSKSYEIVEDIKDDLDIYDKAQIDGKRFVFKDKTNNYFISLRSANGLNIFGNTSSEIQNTANKKENTDKRYAGVGMVVSEGYSKTQNWYSQYKAPVTYKATEVLGTYMPVPSGIENIPEVKKPAEVLEPVVAEKPTPPELPDKPVAPTEPVDPTLAYPGLNPKIATWADNGATVNGVPSDNYSNEIGDPQTTPLRGAFPAIVLDPGLTHRYGADFVTFLDPACGSYTNIGWAGDEIKADVAYNPIAYPASLNIHSASDIGSRKYGGTAKAADGSTYSYSADIPGLSIAYTDDAYTEKFNHITNGISGGTGRFLYNDTWGSIAAGKNLFNFAVMTNETFQFLQNFAKEKAGYANKTSPSWKTYYALLAQYNIDIEAYNTQVAGIMSAYNKALDAYNAYIVALALYNKYLEDLAKYNKYLALISSVEYKYTLFCNEVLSADATRSTLAFSLLKQSSKFMQVSHLLVGNVSKYDKWDGGIFFSGSACRENILDSVKLYNDEDMSDSVIDPVLSSGPHTNTLLRINIDDAPSDARGNIYWASSGAGEWITGKPLSLPIRVMWKKDNQEHLGNGEVPHYYYLQSHDRLDSGRNVNTLNCITINLPIYMSVRVDPDILDNYAAVGEVLGVYFISTLNVQTGSIYEINYPKSNDTCQAFSVGKRRGTYGFDGISIKQIAEA